MSCARDAHGEYCLMSFRIETTSIKPFDGGVLRANSSKCTTGFVPSGESGWIVMKSRQPLFSIPSQLVALPKAEKVGTTPAKRSKGASEVWSLIPWACSWQ